MKGNNGKKEAQIFSHRHKSNENANKLIHKQNKIKLNHTAQGKREACPTLQNTKVNINSHSSNAMFYFK